MSKEITLAKLQFQEDLNQYDNDFLVEVYRFLSAQNQLSEPQRHMLVCLSNRFTAEENRKK